MTEKLNLARPTAEKFISFLNKAVSPYHAVEESIQLLKVAGFQNLDEKCDWKGQIKNEGKYYVTRNKSTLFAFAVGGKFQAGNGFSIIAAHTDSPGLRVKPVSKVNSRGYLQVGVSTYGGGIWRTWFDRDLTVAGRLIYKSDDDKLCSKLVHINRPILCVPNLAIHLSRESNDTFTMNKEDHLRPILTTALADDVSESECDEHHGSFMNAVTKEAGISGDSVVDMDLCVIDTQPAAFTGLYEEFISGGRLDNLVGTYTTVQGLIDSCPQSLCTDNHVRVAVCYDNEECGSESAQGACSSLTEWLLRRITSSLSQSQGAEFEQAIASSYMISADQAHAVHPCYGGKHEENHQPSMHGGVVVKINMNQRYATTCITHAILKVIAKQAQVPLQKFVIRNDSACGSTVGPILSAKLGLQTIDVGTAQLAMHSIREICATTGVHDAHLLFKHFYKSLPGVLENIEM